jgi:4-amino-4-deoxy-L-arabinose transferase-like glycosyltransferase
MHDDILASRAQLRPGTLAIAAIFALIILAQGISSPFQKDAEPQSAEWIQSIVRDGHWLIPHDAYGYTDRKPPLFYWLSAGVAKVSGGIVDEARARTVSVVSGTALAVTVLAWTAANVGASEGWLAFLLMLGTYGFASRATTALTDMLLTFLLFGGYSAIYPLLDAPAPQLPTGTSRRGALVGVILGLGVLTKGPVAIVLCALAVSIYLLTERRNPLAMLGERWPWQALAIAIAIGALWYIPATIAGGHKIIRIIVAENFGHFMPVKLGGTGESSRPFYFIGARLLGGAFPMTPLILPAAVAFYTGEIASETRRAVIYQISMSLAVLVFFSIASVKRDDYILPAIPGIAILCASVFTLATRGAASRLRDVIVVVFALVSVTVLVSLFLFPSFATQFKLRSSDEAYYAVFLTMGASVFLFGLCFLILDMAAIFAVRRRRAIVIGVAFSLLGLCQSLLWTTRLRPGLAYARSVKSFVPTIAANVKGDQLCIASGINYELSYYYDAAVPDLKNPKCAYLLATPRELDAMTPENRAVLKLVTKSNLIGGGGPPALYEISPGAAK